MSFAHCRGIGRLRPAAGRAPGRWGRILLGLLTFGLFGLGSPAHTTQTEESDEEITSSVIVPTPGDQEVLPAPSSPISPGEYLKFEVNWGIINGGNAYLEVPEVTEYQGHEVYRLVARAESNSFISKIYKVRNTIESLWDENAHFSRRYVEDRKEGKYEKQEEIKFDQTRQMATYADGEVLPVPPHVQDALSSFYYTRFQALPMGGSIIFDYHASKKSKPLEVKIIGRERVKVPAGEFDCIVVEPILKAGGVFKNNGRLVIWLTDDDKRMPVLMKSKVTIGSVSVRLEEYRLGRG